MDRQGLWPDSEPDKGCPVPLAESDVMHADQKFDTIVIGAGVAGLGAAALLARDAGERVLVLERAPFIGGRTLSFEGRGNKVVADGIEMDARAFRTRTRIARSARPRRRSRRSSRAACSTAGRSRQAGTVCSGATRAASTAS